MIKKQAFSTLILIITMTLTFYSCQHIPNRAPKEKNGKWYGVTEGLFRDRWWNYYERALSFADGGFWNEAELDLYEAIKQRSEDKRRARTYGRNLIDYFPHRELGVVYFKQGRIEGSIREITESLKMVKSAKAEFYLDKARTLLIKRNLSDAIPPEIHIKQSDMNLVTNASSVIIQGVVRDNTFVRHIQVNNTPLRIDVSDKEIPFRFKQMVKPGKNKISIKAEDMVGNISRLNYIIHVDLLGPLVSIEPVTEINSNSEITISVYAFDDSCIKKLYINDQVFRIDGNKEINFTKNIRVKPDSKEIIVKVEDSAGNVTTAKLPDKVKKRFAGFPVLLAQNNYTASDNMQITFQPDIIPPSIELSKSLLKRSTYLDRAVISGVVKDESNIQSIYVNGKNIISGANKKNTFYFNHIINLKLGRNSISLRVSDRYNNTYPIMIYITRYKSIAEKQQFRLKVAINNFKRNQDGISTGFEYDLEGKMRKRNRFNIIQMPGDIGHESSELNILNAASLNGIEGILFGSVVERENSVTIRAWLKDSNYTDNVLIEEEVYEENVTQNKIRDLSKLLELKIADSFPLVKGLIKEVKNQNVIVNMGTDKKVKEGMRLLVYQDDRSLGQARIENVQNDTSVAYLIENVEKGRIMPEQKVITR